MPLPGSLPHHAAADRAAYAETTRTYPPRAARPDPTVAELDALKSRILADVQARATLLFLPANSAERIAYRAARIMQKDDRRTENQAAHANRPTDGPNLFPIRRPRRLLLNKALDALATTSGYSNAIDYLVSQLENGVGSRRLATALRTWIKTNAPIKNEPDFPGHWFVSRYILRLLPSRLGPEIRARVDAAVLVRRDVLAERREEKLRAEADMKDMKQELRLERRYERRDSIVTARILRKIAAGAKTYIPFRSPCNSTFSTALPCAAGATQSHVRV